MSSLTTGSMHRELNLSIPQGFLVAPPPPQVENLGRCPSTVRPVFPVLVFQPSKQQNRTRTTSSTVLRTPPFLVGFPTGNPPKLTVSQLGTVHRTVLGHLLKIGMKTFLVQKFVRLKLERNADNFGREFWG